jgi:Tfp pilus assembly ATPase PilU
MALRRIPQKVPTMDEIGLPNHIKEILHKNK